MMMLFRGAATILGHVQFATRAEECPRMRMAIESRRWTVEDKDALPENGNKYELVHGELLVTPGPTYRHETVVSRIARIIDRYVESQGLGLVYRPRAVFRIGQEVEVEPDLMVRMPHPDSEATWETAPRPILVVEILSPSSRKHDFTTKRTVYLDEAGIPDYWIVDGDAQTLTICAPGRPDQVVSDRVMWCPSGALHPLELVLGDIFA
jgi:Uma2 family endonuclease